MKLFKTKRPEDKYRKNFFNILDGVYRMSKTVCKEWQTELITIENLGIIIENSKASISGLNGNNSKIAKQMEDAFNNTLIAILNQAKEISKKHGSNGITLGVLLIMINQVKKGFLKGAEK